MGGNHRSAGKDEWITPREIIEALGPFDMDPCSAIGQPWPTAGRHLTIEDNGFMAEWDGLVWMNPPYGRKTGAWLDRLANHGSGIALIFARTETRMFVEHVWEQADAVLFLHGRLHFHYVTGERAAANSGAPSVLVGYGSEVDGTFIADWRQPPELLEQAEGTTQ